jgi:uncharacterized protein YndB with AHSA1/START domain
MHRLGFGLLLALSIAVHAQETDTDRITLEATIDAPVDAVWAAYTTQAGLESWMVPHADVELAVGGKLRTHFDPKGTIGDAQTIENTILAFDPQRMLSLKVAKAPANFPFQSAIQRIWSVVYFKPDGVKTNLTEVTMGFGDDPESQQLRQFLQTGNRMLLDRLQKKFAAGPGGGGDR